MNEMNLYDILEMHAHKKPDDLAYVFMNSDGEDLELTYAQLLSRVKIIANHLQMNLTKGDRVILMYQPGLQFIESILACFASGMIAVPVQSVLNKRAVPRLRGVIENAGAKMLLMTSAGQESLMRIAPDLRNATVDLSWVCSDLFSENEGAIFRKPLLDFESLAFLQYTSGSTGDPKGVMVSHGNVISNMEAIKMASGHGPETIYAGWLPLYHDMGLLGNVFQPLYLGGTSILFSPMTFLTSPVSWLQTISKWRATTSGGPSFAYDLCVKQIQDEELSGLDLSSWTVAFNGSEPIKAKVLRDFAQKFKACGFKESAFYPCYGMAETTLFLSGGTRDEKANYLTVDSVLLASNEARESHQGTELVSCGRSNYGNHYEIVDPETHYKLEQGRVGEIWVRGPSVTKGYWNRTELSIETFQAFTADGEGPFLRTGDLGFIHQGELYINGRLKDLIIVRGQNHYPDDIELTVYEGHPLLRPHGVAAFTRGDYEEQKLVVVAEVQRTAIAKLDESLFKEILLKVRKEVSDKHGLRVSELKLIRPSTLPKTSSGKIRRLYCRELLEKNELDVVEIKEYK